MNFDLSAGSCRVSFHGTVVLLSLCALLAGCTDYGRECSLHIAVVDEQGRPVSGSEIRLVPDTPVQPIQGEYQVRTASNGVAVLKYAQLWSNRQGPPQVAWSNSLTKETLKVAENPEAYFVLTKTNGVASARSLSEQDFHRLVGD